MIAAGITQSERGQEKLSASLRSARPTPTLKRTKNSTMLYAGGIELAHLLSAVQLKRLCGVGC